METTSLVLAFLTKFFMIVNHVIQHKHEAEKLQQMWQRKTHLHCINDIKEKIEKNPWYQKQDLFMIQ